MSQGRTFKQACAQWPAQKKGVERFLGRLKHGALVHEWVLLMGSISVVLLTFFWMKSLPAQPTTLEWLFSISAHLIVVIAAVGVLMLCCAIYFLFTRRAVWNVPLFWGLWSVGFFMGVVFNLPVGLMALSVFALGFALLLNVGIAVCVWCLPALFKKPREKTTLFLGFSTGKLKKRGHARSVRTGRMVGLPLADAAQNIVVLGGIGAGKTTRLMHAFLVQVFCQDFGGLIFDIKGDFKTAVMQASVACKRPIFIIGHGHTAFNLIAGLTPEVAATFLRICLTSGAQHSAENFWVDTATELCRNVLGVLSFSPEHYHLNALFRYIFEPNYRFALRGELSLQLGTLSPEEKARFTSYGQYYDAVFSTFDSKVKSGVQATVAQVLSPFSHPELKRAFCATDKAPLRMETVLQGTVYLVDMPFALWGSTSRVACQLIKLLFFNVVQKRPLNAAWNQERPLFFLCDEYQNLISGSSKEDLSDLNFWDKSRSAKLVGMISTQSVSSFYAALGSHDVTHTVLQNFRQKLCFRTEDTTTLSYLSRVLDKVDVKVKQMSKTTGTRQASVTHNTHEREKSVLDAQLIRQLKQDEVIALLSIEGRSIDDVLRLRAIYVSEPKTENTHHNRLSCSPKFYEILKEIDELGIKMDLEQDPTEQALAEEGYVRDKLAGIARENASDQALWHAYLIGVNPSKDSESYFNYQLLGGVDLTGLEKHAISDLLACWSNAAKEFSNPLLRARCADLVWDFGNVTKNTVENPIVFARSAINNYLNIVNKGLFKSHHLLDQYLARAFSLSLALDQIEDRKLSKEMMFVKLSFPENKTFFYVQSFTTLWKNSALDESLIESMIQLMLFMCEDEAYFFENANHQGIMTILDCFLLTCKNGAQKIEVVNRCAAAFLEWATPFESVKLSDFLSKAEPYLSQRHREQLAQEIAHINQANAQPLNEANRSSMSQTSQEVTSSFLLTGTVDEALRLFLDQFLVFSDSKLLKLSLSLTDNAPTAHGEPHDVCEETQVNPSTGKDFTLAMHAIKQMQDVLLVEAFNNLVKSYGLNASFFIKKIKKSTLNDNHKQAISHGTSAFFNGDFLSALHVLVPQIEGLLRYIACDRCEISLSSNDEHTEEHLTTLDVILLHEKIIDYLGHDLTTHLACLFSQATGFNMRNILSQGLLDVKEVNKVNTLWVIHAIFYVCLRLDEKK